jgi:hypothetical protein
LTSLGELSGSPSGSLKTKSEKNFPFRENGWYSWQMR